MLVHKAYKFRLYPNEIQKNFLSKTFGCARFVWNHHVDAFQNYHDGVIPMSVKELRQTYPWISEVSAGAMQQVENNFEVFKKQFFNKNRKQKIGRPKFKKKGKKDSFKLPNKKFYIYQEASRIRLEKIGKVKIVLDREIPKSAKFVSVTVSRDRVGDFFASILVEENVVPKLERTEKIIGIDLGLKDFCILSNGSKVANPRFFTKSQGDLRRAQQHLNRKQKGGKRRQKQKIKVAKLHRKIGRQRNFFLHNFSTNLVREFDQIAIEDLNVEGIKRKYGKSVSDVGWSLFVSMLKYKASWNNKEILQIGRFKPTTKLCSECEEIVDFLTLADRDWICPSCQTKHDRDINAARSVLLQAVGKDAAQQTWRDSKTISFG